MTGNALYKLPGIYMRVRRRCRQRSAKPRSGFQQCPRVRVQGGGGQLPCRGELDYPSAVHDRDPVGNIRRQRKIVRDDQL